MAIEQRNVAFAKEIDDIALLFPELVRAIRSGKPVTEIIAVEFGALVTAVSGFDQVPEELKSDRKTVLQTLGYRTGELADAFL